MLIRCFLVAALFLASCGGSSAVHTDRVAIHDDPGKPESQWGYDPPLIEVPKGTTVTFANGGAVFHTVTSDDPTRAFDKGVDPGQSVTVRFDRPGTWKYHCGVHPAMVGTVRVCDGACR